MLAVFLCSVSFSMSQITVSTISLHGTVVCSGTSSITMTVTKTPTTVGQATMVQHDVVLPPHLIQRDIIRISVGLSVLQQQQLQSQMPSQAYANLRNYGTRLGYDFCLTTGRENANL